MASLEQDLIEDLTLILEDDPDFKQNVLAVKVKNAIKEFKSARGYNNNVEYYSTDEIIEADLNNYYADIFNLALFDYNTYGAEGQKSHSENEISRSYVERKSYFANVVPIAII